VIGFPVSVKVRILLANGLRTYVVLGGASAAMFLLSFQFKSKGPKKSKQQAGY
jgi:hypothetical protein